MANPMNLEYYEELTKRITDSISKLCLIFAAHSKPVETDRKPDGSSLTELDIEVNAILRKLLKRSGEGWFSEEDEPLKRKSNDLCTWIIDPIDGTNEYILGIPEYTVSIAAWVTDNFAVGLILNPVTGQVMRGGSPNPITASKTPKYISTVNSESSITKPIHTLVSRTEIKGDPRWQQVDPACIQITPCGSIAYKLGLLASGYADAVVSLAPKSSWDLAAGTILVRSAGGFVTDLSGKEISIGELSRVNGVIAGRNELRQVLLNMFAN